MKNVVIILIIFLNLNTNYEVEVISKGKEEKSIDYIEHWQDIYHKSFYVYEDNSSAGNHFYVRGKISSIGDEEWYEGTAQVALIYRYFNKIRSREILNFLRESLDEDGGFLASDRDFLSTGFDWKYFKRKHIGATSWYIFSEGKINPFDFEEYIHQKPFGFIFQEKNLEKLVVTFFKKNCLIHKKGGDKV